jgi:hypothetical protein
MNHEFVRVTMMDWRDAPSPNGRSRTLFMRQSRDGSLTMTITMVGERSLSWSLLQRKE